MRSLCTKNFSVALVALSLQASARNIQSGGGHRRRSIQNNEIDISDDFKVKAPWHGHADKGYPEFDGNPFKQSMVELSSMLSSYVADALKDEEDVPAIFKKILKGAQTTNWKNFDEYLDYWGAAEVSLSEMAEKEAQKKASDDDSNDNSNDNYDDNFYYQALLKASKLD